MRPTQAQVRSSLADLNREGGRSRNPGESGHASAEYLSADVIRAVSEAPEIRVQLLEEARCRLRSGEQPSADALAASMVGRFICDRLR